MKKNIAIITIGFSFVLLMTCGLLFGGLKKPEEPKTERFFICYEDSCRNKEYMWENKEGIEIFKSFDTDPENPTLIIKLNYGITTAESLDRITERDFWNTQQFRVSLTKPGLTELEHYVVIGQCMVKIKVWVSETRPKLVPIITDSVYIYDEKTNSYRLDRQKLIEEESLIYHNKRVFPEFALTLVQDDGFEKEIETVYRYNSGDYLQAWHRENSEAEWRLISKEEYINCEQNGEFRLTFTAEANKFFKFTHPYSNTHRDSYCEFFVSD